MKPRNDEGAEIAATFTVDGDWPKFAVTFESGDGRGRNSRYGEGVEVVLKRLGRRRAVLLSVCISSQRVRNRTDVSGGLAEFSPAGFTLPLEMAGIESDTLRKALGRSGGRVAAKAGGSGNTTRRMTLTVRLPAPMVGAEELEGALAGLAPIAEDPLTLRVLGDLRDIDAGMDRWRTALLASSFPDGKRVRRIPTGMFTMDVEESGKRTNASDVRLGVRPSGAPWSVEINAPLDAADVNGLSTVARDREGRLHLVRQGWLRANPDSSGDVRDDRFRDLSGLTPVPVTGARKPLPGAMRRDWYVVAALDVSDGEIVKQTAAFVHACAAARLGSLGVSLPPDAPQLFGGDERGGTFLTGARGARPEQEVLRLQGEVWLALARLAKRSGQRLLKPRHVAGYEVDGVLDGASSGVLIEIKTGCSASEVYEGVGQLVLYARMMSLSGHRRILLLPRCPQKSLFQAVEAEGLEIYTYSIDTANEMISVSFSDTFLHAFGLHP